MDFRVNGHGTIYMVEPVSKAAKEFVKEHVDVPGWAWLGPRFAVEHRMYPDFVRGMIDEGFNVVEV